jgi:hypothetical protein
MLPVFRSNLSAISFCGLLILLLCLPVLTSLVGHPPREQAIAGLAGAAGPVGMHVREIFEDPSSADVLLLGSSLVRAGVDEPTLEQALSTHLGRAAHVGMLSLNWQGLDLQYFLLRDYLKTHHPELIIWNLPVPGSRNLAPHVEAFRWVRFNEYSDALTGLPLRYRLAIYGDMVLGAPREVLSYLRPNLLSKEEEASQVRSARIGYYGAPFIPESVDWATIPSVEQSYEDPPYDLVRAAGKPLDLYETHFAMKILYLAKENRIKIALLHIPIDTEQGLDYMPERGRWSDSLRTSAPMIGSTSAVLFKGLDPQRVHDFYADQHLNFNGSMLFTRSIIPAILKAYDERNDYE